MLKKIVLLIGLAMIVSCASDIPSVKTLAKYEQANPPTSKSDDEYLIGPGDVLSIDVWKEPDLSKQIPVRLDGMISLPLVHEIAAAGLTCAELQNYLVKQYKDYVDFPEISVTLVQSAKRIYVVGEVGRTGAQALVKEMTIMEAIINAGGPNMWANKSNIRLIRKINGIEKHFLVDYDAILSGRDVSQNILLKPDDVLYVP